MGSDNTNNGMVMPVTPMGGYGNGGYGGGFGYGDSGLFWIIILFLFCSWGNGWGNGFGGNNGGGTAYVANDVQRGFDQSAVMSGLNSINTNLNNGFANAEISRCATQANITSQLSNIALNQATSACDNRAAIADLKYAVATEACADRSAVSDALRDVIENNTNNTQRILDQMYSDKLDSKNERIQELQTQINMMNLAASQNQQTAQILSDNSAQTMALEQYLNPVPVPAYIVANPNCCGNYNYGGCGCNG